MFSLCVWFQAGLEWVASQISTGMLPVAQVPCEYRIQHYDPMRLGSMCN